MPTLLQRAQTFHVNSKNQVANKLVTELVEEIKTCRQLLGEVTTQMGEGDPTVVKTLERIKEYLDESKSR